MRRALLALILCAAAVTTRASDVVTYESITVAATAIGITSTVTNPVGRMQANACSARLETAQIRYRFDGTDPTAAEGMLLEVGDMLLIGSNEDARRIRFIRTGSTSGVLKVSCWN